MFKSTRLPKSSIPPHSHDLALASRLLVWFARHALGASSAQKPLVVLEKEPDVISLFLVPVTRRNLLLLCLKRSLTLSPCSWCQFHAFTC